MSWYNKTTFTPVYLVLIHLYWEHKCASEVLQVNMFYKNPYYKNTG